MSDRRTRNITQMRNLHLVALFRCAVLRHDHEHDLASALFQIGNQAA